ncbi:MAG: pyridoxal phosphate-dependent aminotransferase, partial [Candidatus Omnitrophota bacterium]
RAKLLKQQGRDIISFGAGEPDFDTPDLIKNQAIKAIQEGFTKYTPSTGILDLKKLIVEKFERDNNLDYAPEQIIVSSGAKHCLYNIIQAIVDDGDEVLMGLPYWVSYPEMVKLAQGKPVVIKTQEKNNFKITPKQLKENINEKTKLLILNSPSNPTGVIYEKEELERIAKICIESKIYVISDEIYEKLIYDNKIHVSIASLSKEIYDLTFTVNGFSKSFSMTGWRVGYMGGPKDAIRAISNIQDHSTSNPCSISQKAAVAALQMPGEWQENMRKEFQKRRDFIMQQLDKLNIPYVRPEGAFYIFCNISKFGLDSVTFAKRLLEEAGVAVIPGDGFGCSDYIRLSFATSINQIEKGLGKIKNWLEKI